MPKKLSELKFLSIGLRQNAVMEAVEKIGLASIGDVLGYLSNKFEINLSKTNVKSTLKKSVENDLRSFAGINGKLGIKYYERDGETEVSIEEVDEEKDGSVKNKYNIKYYIVGSETHIRGAQLLIDNGIQFFPQRGSTPSWSVSDLRAPIEKGKIVFIFQFHGVFIGIYVDANEIPFRIIIGGITHIERLQETIKNFREDKIHLKTSLLLVPDRFVNKPVPGESYGHAMIECHRDPHEVSIYDLDSTSGTRYKQDIFLKHEKVQDYVKSKDYLKTPQYIEGYTAHVFNDYFTPIGIFTPREKYRKGTMPPVERVSKNGSKDILPLRVGLGRKWFGILYTGP